MQRRTGSLGDPAVLPWSTQVSNMGTSRVRHRANTTVSSITVAHCSDAFGRVIL